MSMTQVPSSQLSIRPREVSLWAVWAPLLCSVVLLALAPVLGMSGFVQSLAIEMMTFSILALSLDILLGYTGLVSLGHAAFFAISGYAVAIISVRWSADLAITFPLGIAVAALLALPVGWLSIRLSGFYFLMITFALAQMVYTAAFRWKWLTGGSDGILVPGPSLFGHPVLQTRAALYYFTLAAFFVACVLMYWVVRSQFGRTLVGIRENTRRMRALGYNVRRYKLGAFVIAAMFGGVAGVLNAQFNLFVAPESAHWSQSALVLVMVLIGGSGYFLGPIVGTIIVLGLQHGLSSYTEYWGLVLGLLFIILITAAREGVVGIGAGLWRWKRRAAS
jgi:branched-chain amino acid transport system permease protein